MAAKKNPELEELVQIQSHVPPAAGVVDVVPPQQAVASAPAPTQVHLPPPTGENGLTVTDAGRPGPQNVPQPTATLVAQRQAPQAPIPQHASVANLPSMPAMAGMPTPPGQPQQQQQPQQQAGDDHDGHGDDDDIFDPDAPFDEDFDFEGPTPIAQPPQPPAAMGGGLVSPPPMPGASAPAATATDPNAPPFDVDPPAGAQVPPPPPAAGDAAPAKKTRAKKGAAAAAAEQPAGQVPPPPATLMQPPAIPTTPPAPPAGTVNLPHVTPPPAPQGIAWTMPGDQPPVIMSPANAINPLQPPLGPLMAVQPSVNPETQVSEALMAYIEGTVRQVLVDLGVALLHDPSQRAEGNEVHSAIYAMRWENDTLHNRSIEDLNRIQRALAAHQAWVAGVENFWESRYQYLAKELDAQMFRNRDAYNGATKQEKENDCQSRDPNMRALRHHMMLAQGMALALRGMADRFQHLDNGIKRTIDTSLAQLGKGMR